MELRGIPCINLETEETKRKSCCVSRSFGRKIESLDKLKESITTHCLNAAEKIRNDNQTTKSITVFIRTSPFDKNRKYYSNSLTIDLPVATNNSLELVKVAIESLKKIYKYGYFYQKAGVILSKLSEAGEKNLNLLTPTMTCSPESIFACRFVAEVSISDFGNPSITATVIPPISSIFSINSFAFSINSFVRFSTK